MLLYLVPKACLIHFTVSHTILMIFHFTIGRKYIQPILNPRILQYAHMLPHDIIFTTLIVHVASPAITASSSTLEIVMNLSKSSMILTILGNGLSEFRVLFYDESFPARVCCGMMCIRTIVHTIANALMFYILIPDIRRGADSGS